jgi:hypothetical protein
MKRASISNPPSRYPHAMRTASPSPSTPSPTP